MINNKEDLLKDGFIFDFGWIKKKEINIWNKNYNVEIILAAFEEDDDILDKQFDGYNKIDKLRDILNNGKSLIIENLNNLYETNINCLENTLDIKQVILSDMDDMDFGVYCASELDEEHGIGIKVFNEKIIEIGIGDIVL